MKKLLAILPLSLAGLAAFGQGKIDFANDSLHLVYYNPAVFGPPFGGTPISSDNLPSGFGPLAADLYIGTSSSALSLITSTSFGFPNTPGEWTPTHVTLPSGLTGGTHVFVKIQVRETQYVAENTWTPEFTPPTVNWGFSVEFPYTIPSGIVLPGPPFGGAWPTGDFPLPGGARGAIPFGYIPEPSTLTLLGFSAVFFLRKPLISKLFKGIQA